MRKVKQAFKGLRCKYRAQWPRRIDSPEKLAAEMELWRVALEPYSEPRIYDAMQVCKAHYRWRPPLAHEFARLMDRRAGRPVDYVTGKRFDAPAHSDVSRRFLGDIKAILGGQ